MSFEWSDVGDTLKEVAGDALPLIGNLLVPGAGGAVGSLIASALGCEDSPDAVSVALRKDPDALVKLKGLEMQHKEKMQAMLLQADTARMAERTKQLAEVNATIRAGLASDSLFKSGWRSATGWALAALYGAVGGSLVYSLVQVVQSGGDTGAAMTAIMTLIVSMSGVLGINIHSHSNDRQVDMGMQPKGILGALRKP